MKRKTDLFLSYIAFLYFHLERRADENEENHKGDKVHWPIAAKMH